MKPGRHGTRRQSGSQLPVAFSTVKQGYRQRSSETTGVSRPVLPVSPLALWAEKAAMGPQQQQLQPPGLGVLVPVQFYEQRQR